MRRKPIRRSPIPLLVCLVMAAPLCAGDADDALARLAAGAGQGEPRLRIGLSANARVEISSSRAYRVIDPVTGRDVWKPVYDEVLQVVTEGGPEEAVATVFRVQIGAFASREAAQREKSRLEQKLGAPGVVRHDPDRGNWRVRMGRAEDRLALNSLIERLRAEGLENIWVAEEAGQEVSGVSLRIVDAGFDSKPTGLDRLVVLPSGGGRLQVGERSYRGIMELRVNSVGLVQPVNWVELEQYLLGVVPAELGPEVWPQLEALRAQAIAARTYAWRNRRQFEDEGFDLCATPRCQVYHGASVEHPLSDRAVASTRGEVLTWQGNPIDALYTATCGGHTEDGQAVFPEQDEPYLRGVPCRAENDALASLRAAVKGREIVPLSDETGADVTRAWSLLRAAGVIDAGFDDPRRARAAVAPEALRGWTRRLARLAGIAAPSGPGPDVSTLGRAAASLLSELGWSERASVLLSEQDPDALLRDDEAASLPAGERRALAYLAWSEAVRPFADGRFHVERAPSAARLAPALARIGQSYRAFDLREGVVSGVGRSSIRLVRGRGELRLHLTDRPYLFSLAGGKPVPSSRLELWPGDRVRYRVSAKGRIDFLELAPPVKGISDDRTAAVYSWEERRSRRQLEQAINRRISVGRLQDLRVVRRGVSGRVVELEVVGSEGNATVRGFDVRRLLDLRESLMVIEIQRDEKGRIEAAVFAGKGWGHGVGLCQVGAYGMALRGASYREILAHYYRGASIQRLAGSGR